MDGLVYTGALVLLLVLLWLHQSCRLGHSRSWHNGPWSDTERRRAKLCDRCQRPIGWALVGEMKADRLPQVVAGAPTGKVTVIVDDDRKSNLKEFPRASER